MQTSPEDEVIVVGAGIVGICCGLSLLEKGAAVTMIDREQPAQGASSGNAGVISPWSNVPQCLPGVWKKVPKWLLDPNGPVSIPPRHLLKSLTWSVRFLRNASMDNAIRISDAMAVLNAPSIEIYRNHLDGTGQEHLLVDSIYLHVFRNRLHASPNGTGWQLRARHGTPMEIIDEDELRALEPALSPEYKAALVIRDQARTVLPGRLGAVLAEKFQSLGGRLLRGAVHRLTPLEAGTWRLDTDLGELLTTKPVLAAGAWTTRLLEPLGMKLPLAAERGYHLTFRNPGVTLNNSIMEADRLFVCSSMENGVRSAGTSEFAGLDASPNYKRARSLKALTKELVPDINIDDTAEWMGTRPTLPDNLPCIGEVGGLTGLLVAFGHSHWGMSMAPQTGRIIADLATGGRPDIDLSPYRIDRFL